ADFLLFVHLSRRSPKPARRAWGRSSASGASRTATPTLCSPKIFKRDRLQSCLLLRGQLMERMDNPTATRKLTPAIQAPPLFGNRSGIVPTQFVARQNVAQRVQYRIMHDEAGIRVAGMVDAVINLRSIRSNPQVLVDLHRHAVGRQIAAAQHSALNLQDP